MDCVGPSGAKRRYVFVLMTIIILLKNPKLMLLCV